MSVIAVRGERRAALPARLRGPFLYHAARLIAEREGYLDRLRDRHGDVFTLHVPSLGHVVAIADPVLVKQVLTADPEVLEAGEGNKPLEIVVGPLSLLRLDGSEHLRQRKLLLGPFHGAELEQYAEVMRELAAQALEDMPTDRPFALLHRMRALTLEIIMRVVFGIEDEDRLAALRSPLRRALRLVTSPQIYPRYALRSVGGLRTWRSFNRAVAQADELILAEIARRRADPRLDERTDIVAMMLRARTEDGQGMSDAALRDQLATLLVAGHETTATALAWTLERLTHHPAAMARLAEEARSGDGAYTEAVIDESMRVRPPVPFIARRLTRSYELGEHLLPRGVRVLPLIVAMHRRADLYPDPLAFRPERFLDARPETYAWLPFGGGIRRCIGASFAVLEMKEVLREFLRRGHFLPASPRDERALLRAIFFTPERGGRVVLQRGPSA